MYQQFYEFSKPPFANVTTPECFYTAESAIQVLEEISNCVTAGNGIALLTAPSGMGKTHLCRKIIHDFENKFATVFLANSNYATRRSLLQSVLYELGHSYVRRDEQEVRHALYTVLKTISAEGKSVLLVVDEAHLLSDRLLEEIRGLTNLVENDDSIVRVLLSGQLQLEERLTSAELSRLNERIACQVSLEPLSTRESAQYIAERLQNAGSNQESIFSTSVVDTICQASDGVPRSINQFCDHALLLGYVSEQQPVELDTALEALEDLKHLPTQWNEPTAAKFQEDEPVVQPSIEIGSPVRETEEELLSEEQPADAISENPEMASFEVGSEPASLHEQESSTEENDRECDYPPILIETSAVVPTLNDDEFEQLTTEAITSFEVGAEIEQPVAEETIDSTQPFVDELPSQVEQKVLQEQLLEEDTCELTLGQDITLADPEQLSADDCPELTTMTSDGNTNRQVEPLFDRYALLDAGKQVTSRYLQAAEERDISLLAIGSSATASDSDQLPPEEELEGVSLTPICSDDESGMLNEQIRNELIEACEQTKQSIQHRLHQLEENWGHQSEIHESEVEETYPLERAIEDLASPIRLDLLVEEA